MEEKLAVNKGSVTRLAWLRHSAEGRTKNKLQKEGKVNYVFSWLERSSVLQAVLEREALGSVLGSGIWGCANRRRRSCWLSICPTASDAPFGERRGSPGLAWLVAGGTWRTSVPSVSRSLEDRGSFMLSFRNTVFKLLHLLIFEEFGFKVWGSLL